MEKIFGIGLNKTGTSSLRECLKILGYRHAPWRRQLVKDALRDRNLGELFAYADQYESFEDWPWPLFYPELDNQYPESKFILTLRKNEYVWLKSLKKHALRSKPFINSRKYAYGYAYPFRHEEAHLEFYRRHLADVKAYFKHRPDDLLLMCWETGDGWEKLCNFLNKPVPSEPLPHANNSKTKETKLHIYRREMINRLLIPFR